MLGITYEEFEQHYLRIIAQIALKAVQKGDIDIIEEFDPITLDFRAKKEDDYQGDWGIKIIKRTSYRSRIRRGIR
ncbi:MAG: hypothetical protein AB8B46_03770 [Candidatus Midichloriaceae bacterium]